MVVAIIVKREELVGKESRSSTKCEVQKKSGSMWQGTQLLCTPHKHDSTPASVMCRVNFLRRRTWKEAS